MDDQAKIAFFVSLHGQVQGIGLRRRILSAAKESNVFGWVRNRKAGHVQAHFEGKADQVKQIIADLQLKMIDTEVSDCVMCKVRAYGYEDFKVLKAPRALELSDHMVESALARNSLLNRESRDLDLLLRQTALNISEAGTEDWKLLAQEIPSRYLGEPLIQKQKKLPVSLREIVGSFAAESWSQRLTNKAMSSTGLRSAEALLDDKKKGQDFARLIGLRVPELFQNGVPLSKVQPRAGIVVKPVRSANSTGVYSFLAEDRIFNLGASLELNSIAEFLEDAAKIPVRIGRPDKWMVEELILSENGNLPNDLKMFTFYGHVAIIQEATRLPTRICYYDREGKKISTGRYENRAFDGTGVLPKYIELAEQVSLKVPIPFMRIDFLKAGEGPVFGEFTPKPGNFQGFNAATDAWLGRCFAQARGRLMADFRRGKSFDEFDSFVASRTKR